MSKYNQQYLDCKTGKTSGYDWVDCLNFILITNAEATDGALSHEELNKIREINEITFSHWVGGEGMPYLPKEPDAKLEVALKWYFSIVNNSPKDQIQSQINKEFIKTINFMKSQPWFNPTFAKSIINWLVEIAESDGNVIAEEKGSINSLAEFFDVKKPFK